MSRPELNPAILATMTDEERAEITGADDNEIASLSAVGAEKDPVHNKAAPAAAAAATADDEGASDEDGADEGAAGDDAAAAPAASTAAEGAAAPAPETAPASAPAARSGYRFDLPDDYEARVAAAKTAVDEAGEKFDAGELTREEYQRAITEATAEQRELDRLATKAEIASDMQLQSAEQVRQAAIERLFDAAKTAGVDYRADQGKMRDLDTFVRALAGDDANADKPLDWFLEEGHKRVKLLHGIDGAAAPAPAAAAKTPEQIKAEAAAARRVDPPGVGASGLAHVPGGDGPGSVGDEFDDVMSLDGDAFEAAIARMAKTQPERFARFQSNRQ